MIVQKRLWIRLISIVLPQTYMYLECRKYGSSYFLFWWKYWNWIINCKGKDTLWNLSFRAFHEVQFLGHFMKHEIFSWNLLASKFHCVVFFSIKKLCLQRKVIFWRIALILINNVCYLQNKNKKILNTKIYLHETKAEKREGQKCMC